MEDGPGHHEPLGHPARERVDRRLGEAGQLEALEQFVSGLLRFFGTHAEQPAVPVQVLQGIELTVQRVLLRHHADQLLGQRRVGTTSIPPTVPDHPLG